MANHFQMFDGLAIVGASNPVAMIAANESLFGGLQFAQAPASEIGLSNVPGLGGDGHAR